MGTQGPGRKRIPNRNGLTAEDDALSTIAREAEARLAAKRAARAEAREIRMKELERQQKEIYQVQKKYYGLDSKGSDGKGLDNKWGHIEQWMEDSEQYSRPSRKLTSVSDDDERMSVGSRSSVRGLSSHSLKKSKKKKKPPSSKASNGYDGDYNTVSSRSSKHSDESRLSRSSKLDLQPSSYAPSDLYSSSSLPSSRQQGSSYNGYQQGSVYEDRLYSSSRRFSSSKARAPSEHSGFLGPSSRTSSRASSACASPVEDCGSSVASFLRSAAGSSGLPRDLDHVTIPDLPDVDERLDRDYLEKGSSRAASTLSSMTLASLGGSSSRRGSDASISADTETSIREIKEIHELKDQIQDVEAKYMQSLKEVKDCLVEAEEKYRKAMVSNAQLDNEKSNLMYQVDTLKDSLMELEELLSEVRRECEDKAKDLEREKQAHSILQFQFSELKGTLKQSEELLTEIRQLHLKQDCFVREIADLQETVQWKDKKIGALERQKEYSDAIRNERDELRDEVVQLKDVLKKHGIVLGPDLTTNGETGEAVIDGPAGTDSAPSTEVREGSSLLEIRLRKLVDERENLMEQVKKLQGQLEQRKQNNGAEDGSSPEGELLENGTDPSIMDVQRDASRQIGDLKFKLVKSEQEVTALEQNVTRLEGQVTRYKSSSENAEKVEDELKAEKRKLQRELRSALDKMDELEASNSHLSKRMEKMKSNRNAAPPL